MVSEVIDPHSNCVPAGLLCRATAGVDDAAGKQVAVSLLPAVVPRHVGMNPPTTADRRGDGMSAFFGPVVGVIVGDDPMDPLDGLTGEEILATGKEPQCGGGLLVVEGFGVSQQREVAYRRMQVDVIGPGSGPGLDNLCHSTAAAVSPPVAIRTLADLFRDQEDHIPGSDG